MDERAQDSKASCIQRAGTRISEGLELFFFKLGYHTAMRPWTVIFCCLFASALCGLGLLRFQMKDMSEPIWVPAESRVLANQHWAEEHFPLKYRFNDIIVAATNVLSPEVLVAMLEIDKRVKGIEETNSSKDNLNFNWTTLCMRYGPNCWSNSLLELWNFDESRIRQLTQQEILAALNNIPTSPLHPGTNMVTRFLGDVSYDTHGQIIGARATKMLWVIKSTLTNELNNKARVPELAWEKQFINITLSAKKRYSSSLDIYVRAVRSFRDESDNSFDADVALLLIGVVIIVVYVAIVLGKFNEVEHKVYLALVGVFGIGLASLVAYGLASAIGMFYGPVHPILPFLLLGVGVDDMFVIIEAWNNLTPEQRSQDLTTRIAHTMKNAGVSVTVTSVTDFVAFSIGASTELPALRSFCVYAALGILVLYIMQATFFVAWLTIDARRQEGLRDACCMFIKYTTFMPNKCSRKEFLPWFLRKFYAPMLTTMPAKVFVSTIALAIFGATIYGSYKLKTNSDLDWFLPTDSYLTVYLKASETYYPNDGLMANLYIGNIDYYNEGRKLLQLHADLREKDYVATDSIQSWFQDYIDWLRSDLVPPQLKATLSSTDKYPISEKAFYDNLVAFLDTYGLQYATSLKWNTTDIGQPRKLNATKIGFTVRNQPNSGKEVQAMNSMDALTDEYFGSATAFIWASLFRNWETNRVIQSELYTNLCLAFVAVLVVTLTLVANVWMCVLVCLCVIVNVVNVCGFMHFWGLTIDTLTSILLILSIGLAVDYSAHIGHMFMMLRGTKEERTRNTVSLIGPAIVHGGFSTFLAFVLLSNSNSYVFITFFKVFFLVVIFGLFNGLTLLPVVLSWLGPASHLNARKVRASSALSLARHYVGQTSRQQKDSEGAERGVNGSATLLPLVTVCNGDAHHSPVQNAATDIASTTWCQDDDKEPKSTNDSPSAQAKRPNESPPTGLNIAAKYAESNMQAKMPFDEQCNIVSLGSTKATPPPDNIGISRLPSVTNCIPGSTHTSASAVAGNSTRLASQQRHDIGTAKDSRQMTLELRAANEDVLPTILNGHRHVQEEKDSQSKLITASKNESNSNGPGYKYHAADEAHLTNGDATR